MTRVKKIVLALLGTAIFLGILEALLAILFLTPVRKYITAQPFSFIASRYYLAHRTNCQDMQYDPQLTYVLIPDHENRCKGLEYDVPVQTNSQGYRDSEESLRHPEIIALGDSFTFGHGVAQDQSWPAVLENITGFQVLNAGIESYGTARELELLKRLDTTNLKYLIVQYHVSDIHENLEYIKNGYKTKASVNQEQFDTWIRMLHQMHYYPGLLIHDSAGFLRQYFGKDLKYSQKQLQSDTQKHVNAFLPILNRIHAPPECVLIVTTVGDTSWWRSSFAVETTLSEISGNNSWSGFDPDYFLVEAGRRMKSSENSLLVQNAEIVNPVRALSDDAYFIIDDHLNPDGHRRLAEQIGSRTGKKSAKSSL